MATKKMTAKKVKPKRSVVKRVPAKKAVANTRAKRSVKKSSAKKSVVRRKPAAKAVTKKKVGRVVKKASAKSVDKPAVKRASKGLQLKQKVQTAAGWKRSVRKRVGTKKG